LTPLSAKYSALLDLGSKLNFESLLSATALRTIAADSAVVAAAGPAVVVAAAGSGAAAFLP
jgi:hypothetical protein